jgi:guanosine-3',5'-bis(diphosphate) 3'-pyrophosphohydrolase
MAQTFSLNWLRNDLHRAIGESGIDLAQVDRALDLAFRYHDGQYRESANDAKARVPYITHPVGVAKNCAAHYAAATLDDDLTTVISAALVHDILEDTSLDFSELQAKTSPRVAELVRNLTKPSATQFADRTERNQRFLERIESGDSTTRFIKVCDALHNLSRPDAMPASLLNKTIRKAKRDYLPLALDARFGDQLRARLVQAIEDAERHERNDANSPTVPTTLDEFLSHCVERSSGKVLEKHDVQDTLLALEGVSAITYDTLDGFIGRILADTIGDNQQNTRESVREKLLKRGEIVLTGKPFLPEKVQALPFQRVVSLPIGSVGASLHDRKFLFLGLDAARARPWVSVSSLRAATSILTERAREQEARVLSEYADWVAAAALQMDPRVARDLGMSREQIGALAALLNAANAEIGAMRDAIQFLVENHTLEGEVLAIDFRSKQPVSAAEKLMKRANGNTGALDDIIGLRIVTLNTKAARRIVESMKKHVGQSSLVLGSNQPIVEGTFDVRDVSTVHGYSATHVVFDIVSSYHAGVSVPCEIQVRTLFQDAWARVAHKKDYKSGARTPRGVRSALQSLAEICAKADEIADRLAD